MESKRNGTNISPYRSTVKLSNLMRTKSKQNRQFDSAEPNHENLKKNKKKIKYSISFCRTFRTESIRSESNRIPSTHLIREFHCSRIKKICFDQFLFLYKSRFFGFCPVLILDNLVLIPFENIFFTFISKKKIEIDFFWI